MKEINTITKSYQAVLSTLKDKIKSARLRASYTVNTELLGIYWEIGKTILEQESVNGWGAKTIEILSKDLQSEFEDMKGLSPRNLRYMREFSNVYRHFPYLQAPPSQNIDNESIKSRNAILQAPLAKLSWYHHVTLLDRVRDPDIRQFYINKTIENGWSRNVMVHQIEAELHKRQGQLPTNFKTTIAPEESELVQQIFKDPYKFEFLYLGNEAKEKDLENALITQITDFLLELGQGFSYMGRQRKISLGNKEYYFDLLFYHTKLKRYIIIELKIGEFEPEHLGKMEFYLKLADEQLRDENDGETIGLILCKTRDGLVAEYALRDSRKPIGIAEYKISHKLPEDIISQLPTIAEIENKMKGRIGDIRTLLKRDIKKQKQIRSKT